MDPEEAMKISKNRDTENADTKTNTDGKESIKSPQRDRNQIVRVCEDPSKNDSHQINPDILATPKRKLSPTFSTPTGRQRKLSTTAYNSPVLRARLETVGDQDLHNEVTEAPDLITGIGLLVPREREKLTGEPSQDTSQADGNSVPQTSPLMPPPQPPNLTGRRPRHILSSSSRPRAYSLATKNDGQERKYRRRVASARGRNDLASQDSPVRQPKITDVFSKQKVEVVSNNEPDQEVIDESDRKC